MENNINESASPVQIKRENKKYPGPVAAGSLFSLATIFLTYGGVLLPFENNYLRSGLGEVLFILLPVLIFLILGKYNLKDTLKLRRTRPVNYVIIVLLMMVAMPIVAVFNALGLIIIKQIFSKNLPVDQIRISDVPTLLIALLVIGVSAAVCEETLFRGSISKGYERFGVIASLLTTSILFGILHRDIQKCISTILLGVLIGFIVHRTKSIYGGMVAHFTNNAAVVFITYQASKLYKNMEQMDINQALDYDFSNIPLLSIVFVIIFYALIFLVFVSTFVALLYALYRTTKSNFNTEVVQPVNEAEPILPVPDGIDITQQQLVLDRIETENIHLQQVTEKARTRRFSWAALISVLPGLVLIFLIFTAQILYLMDINNGIVYDVLKALLLKK